MPLDRPLGLHRERSHQRHPCCPMQVSANVVPCAKRPKSVPNPYQPRAQTKTTRTDHCLSAPSSWVGRGERSWGLRGGSGRRRGKASLRGGTARRCEGLGTGSVAHKESVPARIQRTEKVMTAKRTYPAPNARETEYSASALAKLASPPRPANSCDQSDEG